MGALRKQRDRLQQFLHLFRRVAMAEHRQTKRRLGDEYVAWHHFEWCAGRIRRVLVVAGSDDADILAGDRDLGRAQHVAGGVEFDGDVAEPDLLAIGDRLRGPSEVVAVAQPHHVKRLLGGQHRAVAGASMVGMAVGNDRALDRPHRIDVKSAGLAAQAGGHRHQDVLRAHVGYIGRPQIIF